MCSTLMPRSQVSIEHDNNFLVNCVKSPDCRRTLIGEAMSKAGNEPTYLPVNRFNLNSLVFFVRGSIWWKVEKILVHHKGKGEEESGLVMHVNMYVNMHVNIHVYMHVNKGYLLNFKGYLFCSVKITFLFREPPVTLNAIRDAKVTASERTVTALLRVSQKKLYLYFSKLWLKASRILEQKFFLEKIFFLSNLIFTLN